MRVSSNPAHNNQARDAQVNILQRTQEWLWEDFAWPHLNIERQYAVQAGQRYYDFGTDFDLERIESLHVRYSGGFVPLGVGIENEHYYIHDSDLDQRAWPVRRWRVYENDQIEIWPIGDQNADPTTRDGFIKVKGIAKLSPLVKDTDRADLDDRLITLYAAAELLGGRGAKDAQTKLNLATTRYAKLRGRLTKSTKFTLFNSGRSERRQRAMITHYRPPGS
jgi:hypothetical protein